MKLQLQWVLQLETSLAFKCTGAGTGLEAVPGGPCEEAVVAVDRWKFSLELEFDSDGRDERRCR